MAGVIPGFSLQRMIDSTGVPLVNGKLYIIQAGTTSTPQNAYSDSGLTALLPNPLTCDGFGWLPQFFVADGSIKVRLTDANGNQQLVADNILVVGPSGSSGGGSTVDPTTVLATGDLKVRYGTGPLTGFVRGNGRTIGSATSGATEYANSGAQALFEYLWGADANLAVSGGRGSSAASDWTANKTITLPDWRGRAIAALDDMGNTAAGRLTASYFGADATVLGAAGGAESHTLARSDLPNVNATLAGTAGTVTVSSAGIGTAQNGSVETGSSSPIIGIQTAGGSGTATGTFTPGGSTNLNGNVAQTAFDVASPMMLATVYLKL